MTNVKLRIVGECIIEVGDRRLEPDAPHQFAMLLYLASQCGRSVPRAELIELFFPGEVKSRAASHNLRQLLYRLRQLGAPISQRQQGIAIDAAHVHSGVDEAINGSYAERRARFLISYTVLPQYAPLQSPRLLEWVEEFRDRAHTSLRRQLAEDMDTARKRADWQFLELIARRSLELDPLNETATLGLAEAIARTGSKMLAVGILAEYERELGEGGRSLALPAQLLRKRINASCQATGNHTTASLPLLGRSNELAELLETWERARSKHFCTVSVTGEKSIGKSRLLEEFGAIVEMDGSGSILMARLTPSDRDRPLSLFADLAKQLLTLPGAAGCDPDSLPRLRRLAGASIPTRPITSEHSQAQFEDAAIRRAICDLLESVSEERPLLCLVDEADELDQASRELLAAVQQRLPGARIQFVLCMSREYTRPAAPVIQGATEVRLAPLSATASAALADIIVQRNQASADSEELAWCLEVAAGNPGHLELLIRQVSRSPNVRLVPADLLALADRRIRDLSPEAQYALQATAVFGDAVTPTGVAAMTGLSTYALLTALHELDNASLLARFSDGIRCRTAIVSERALRSASPITLTMMHERAASYLEQKYVGGSQSQVIAWRIATHWQQAGERRRANECLRTCWQQAVDIGQPIVASSAIRQALTTAASPDEQAELLDDLIGVLQSAGAMNLVAAAVEERALLSPRVGDSKARLEALSLDRLEAHFLSHDNPLQHKGALAAHARSTSLDTRRRIRAARLLMIASDVMLDDALAAATFEIAGSITTTERISQLLQQHVGLIFHSVFGDPDEALRLIARIDELVQEGERSWYAFVSRRNCSLARQLVGDGTPNYAEMETVYQECVDASMVALALESAAHLTSILIDDGNIEEARGWMQQSETLVAENPELPLPIEYLSAGIDLALTCGNETHARALVSQMQENSRVYSSGRLRNDLLLYRLRVEQYCQPAPACANDVAELIRFHHIAKRFGRHDDHMDVLWVALNSVGRKEEASRLLLEYLQVHRRERRGCRYILRLRTAEDPAWQSLGCRFSLGGTARR